uniref:Uncharacterized protein n=1 Tax=Siphoviridae sp. ctZiV25 TaxID=2825560 RepID=A0A8S5TXV4_9CAUD|nr:MAG TPA: protein of unknown function (DUF4157) [Siphoviridae sp. ctZiV25]
MKAGKLQYDIIYLDILKSGVLFIVSPDKETFLKNISRLIHKEIIVKQHQEELIKDLIDCFSKDKVLYPGTTFETFTTDGTQYLIIVLQEELKDSDSILVHEMYHVVYKLFKERGIEDEETFAYTLEYLFSEGKKLLEKFKKESSLNNNK